MKPNKTLRLGLFVMAGCMAMTFTHRSHGQTPNDSSYRHPLLSVEGKNRAKNYFATRRSANARDFLRDTMTVTGVRVDADGEQPQRLPELVSVRRTPVEGHTPSVQPQQKKQSIGPSVERWIDDPTTRPDGMVKLSLGIHPGWNPIVSAAYEQRLAMAEGRLRTRADAIAIRRDANARRSKAGRQALMPLRNTIAAMGGKVLGIGASAGTMDVEISIAKLDQLLAHPDVARIERSAPVTNDAGIAYDVDGDKIDGRELEDLLQTTQAYDRGYSGDPAEAIALVEGGGDDVFNSHPGFGSRFDNCVDIGTGSCSLQSPLVGASHATASASVLLGDVTLGQDWLLSLLAVNPDLMERERSGVARGSSGRGFSGSSFSFLEDRLSFYDDTYILTQSASNASADPDCRGETTAARNWNTLFESGIAVFNSAGNDGHTDPNDCTVSSPATAIGAFTVGAYIIDDNDNEAIYAQSDRGGNGTVGQGRHRTVMDIMGPSKMEYAYPHFEWPVDDSGAEFRYGTQWGGSGGPSGFCCTSSATPAVAGTAAVFREWYKDVYNDSIDDPGILYANLLLMGDRRNEAPLLGIGNYYKDTGFDGLWGAGKLRLRLFDAEGLDAPMSWATGSVCVDDGFDVYIDIGSVSSDVDIINAVLWWYDRRHDDGTHHDNIDLDLEFDDGSGFTSVLSSHTKDNKERVALERPDGGTYRLKLRGERVTAQDEGCGPDSMQVYWAYVAEDGDREAAEGLDGVRSYPLDIYQPFDFGDIIIKQPL